VATGDKKVDEDILTSGNKYQVERVVGEFEVIKKVLINNAITVDLDEIDGDSKG